MFDNNFIKNDFNQITPSSSCSSSSKNTLNLRNQDANEKINFTTYSPNRIEWTKFNNTVSPFTTNLDKHQQMNSLNSNQVINQINLQTNDAKCLSLMTPANFDKIELDPTLIHPLPVKVSSANQINSTLVNKESNSRVFKNSTGILK